MYTVKRMPGGFNFVRGGGYIEYGTESADIKDAIATYGQTNDVLYICDEDGKVIAGAVWPQGRKQYRVLIKEELESVIL